MIIKSLIITPGCDCEHLFFFNSTSIYINQCFQPYKGLSTSTIEFNQEGFIEYNRRTLFPKEKVSLAILSAALFPSRCWTLNIWVVEGMKEIYLCCHKTCKYWSEQAKSTEVITSRTIYSFTYNYTFWYPWLSFAT